MRENSPGLRFLRDLFNTGEINGTESPKDVRDRYATLQQYDAKTFGDKYRKYKPSQGLYLRLIAPKMYHFQNIFY